MNKPIGILGGTFDPIHNGHLRIASELETIFLFEKIHFIPCKQPVHKNQAHASTKQRCHMIELAIKQKEKFILDKRELERETPSYMVLTLESLRKDFENVPLCLIIGSDAYNSLTSWYHWDKILSLSHIIVVSRPDAVLSMKDELMRKYLVHEKELLYQSAQGCIYIAPFEMLDISSTVIRQMIHMKKNPRNLMPDAVLEYIEQEKIYL